MTRINFIIKSDNYWYDEIIKIFYESNALIEMLDLKIIQRFCDDAKDLTLELEGKHYNLFRLKIIITTLFPFLDEVLWKEHI